MPLTPTVSFHEDQHFRGSMLWSISAILAAVAIVLGARLATREPVAGAVTIGILVAVFVLFALARLETEVRADAIYVHFHGLWPTRRIALADIAAYEAKRYTMWESGGWGVHLTMSGMAYNVSGNDGVIFKLRNGRSVLVGTQRLQEFASAVATALRSTTSP